MNGNFTDYDKDDINVFINQVNSKAETRRTDEELYLFSNRTKSEPPKYYQAGRQPKRTKKQEMKKV